MDDIKKVIVEQREFFKTNITLDLDYRLNSLIKLKSLIEEREKDISTALKADLGKSEFESYSTEIGIVLSEISFTIKNLKKWAKPKKVKTPITAFKSNSYIYAEPYGNTLIIAPWNYPFQLSIAPLIGSIAAGNTAIIKPSSTSKETSRVIEDLINDNFPSSFIHVITGEKSKLLLEEQFDYIFYTGSVSVGKKVMTSAAKYLTPVTLELGGKSPCIVDSEGELEIFAKRMVWGKFLNAGQTCVAPDYLLVQKNVKDSLVKHLTTYIEKFFGKYPLNSKDYGRIVSEKHFDRLVKLLGSGNVIYGGEYNRKMLYISPTLLDNVSWDNPIMEEEIFGPLFPILEYTSLDEAIEIVNSHPKPLALYFFSSNDDKIERVIKCTSYGGGCINDTIMHLSTPYLPFGGVGNSGMGSYHGKGSFDTFTHHKSVLKRSNTFDPDFRYPPYEDKIKLVKKFLK